MSLPDRTLCWVEGPPWDRVCEEVEKDPYDGAAKIYGLVVDENEDDRGQYVVITLGEGL